MVTLVVNRPQRLEPEPGTIEAGWDDESLWDERLRQRHTGGTMASSWPRAFPHQRMNAPMARNSARIPTE